MYGVVSVATPLLSVTAGSVFNRSKGTDNLFGEMDDDDEGEDVMDAGQVRGVPGGGCTVHG